MSLKFNYLFIFFIILTLFVSVFYNNSNTDFTLSISKFNNEFIWPIPGYSTITSYFGYRILPTIGASINHLGIDIAAPERSYNNSKHIWNS